MKDPKTVVDAILAEGRAEQTDQVQVFPLTIRRYALLERIGSPFVEPESDFSVNNVIPSAFVMTRTVEQLKKYCTADQKLIREDAFDWAEGLELDDVPKMTKIITDQFLAVNKASPEATAQVPEKKTQEQGI